MCVPAVVTDEKAYFVMENCNIFLGGNDFGLRVYIIQRTQKIIMQLRNISVYQNRNSAIDIMHLSKLGPTSPHPGTGGGMGGDLTTLRSMTPYVGQNPRSNVTKSLFR